LPDEQEIVLVVTTIKVEYLPTRVPLPALTSKTFLATFGYFSIGTYVIALLKAQGPLGPYPTIDKDYL
jgi:hypothetical protein